MKARVAFLVGFVLVGCSSTGTRTTHERGHKHQKPDTPSYSVPDYAHALTTVIRAQIQNCNSAQPDGKICKSPDFWTFPLRSVKFALVTAKLTDSYLVGATSNVFGNELGRAGFSELKVTKEDQIPPGAIVIYDGATPYAEIKGDDGYYYSNQARPGSAFDRKIAVITSVEKEDEQMTNIKNSTLEFTSISIWIKHDNQ